MRLRFTYLHQLCGKLQTDLHEIFREGNMGDGGGRHWLVRMEWRPARWSMCLPLLISPCTIKSRSCLLALANPGGPRKRAVKRLRCGGGSREGWQWASEYMIKFWCRSGSPFGYMDVFRISHYWEIWKVASGHSFILIRQMAALVRRPLAEVCTVPVLLVWICCCWVLLSSAVHCVSENHPLRY